MCPLKMNKGARQLIIMPVRAEVVAQSAPVEEVSRTGTLAAEAAPDPQPAPSTPPSMITDTTTPPAATATAAEPASDIDLILETIEDLRESLSTNLGDLKTVAGKLKQIKRSRKPRRGRSQASDRP
jgi:hypothetical protein